MAALPPLAVAGPKVSNGSGSVIQIDARAGGFRGIADDCALRSNQFDLHLAPHKRRRALQRRERDIARRIEQSINLRPTGLQHHGQARLAQRLLLHRFGELPHHHFLDGQRLGFLE